ncbi:MAG: sigma-54 dependent transcriptional regulator [Planctomycetes bacterium]|nr:sigma-54 dependent transcriptional regulator [Planctomycetota bacterium]
MISARDTVRPRIGLVLPRGGEHERLLAALGEAGFEPRDASPDAEEFDPAAWLVDPAELGGDWSALGEHEGRSTPVILLASFGSIGDAVDAMRRGAADYLTRPIAADRLVISLKRALEDAELRTENERLKESLGERFGLGRILSRDPRMLEVKHIVESVADTRAHLLITGESGTGKTLLARAIHQRSSRHARPFVEVNCGALPVTLLESELFGHVKGAFTGATKDKAGRFEAADTGTLFLDEIATAPPELQVKLLRVLQDKLFERVGDTETRQVDVRVIAATNRDLRDEVRQGRFREDLYWRLAVVPIHLPPLRERPRDVALLAEHFVTRAATEYGRPVKALAPDALAALCNAPWPGNVRELENTLERAVLLARGDVLELADLGADFAPPVGAACELRRPLVQDAQGAFGVSGASGELGAPGTPGTGGGLPHLKAALAEPERELILRALERHGGSRKATAQALGVNRTTLFNKMRKYGLLGIPSRAALRPRTPPAPGHPSSEPAT